MSNNKKPNQNESKKSVYEPKKIDIDKFQDLTYNGEIKKHTIKKGTNKWPDKCYLATISYILRLYSNEYYSPIIINEATKENPLTFTIGYGEVKKFLEIAVQSMLIGEESEFIIGPSYAETETESIDNIPQNSSLLCTINLIKIEKQNDLPIYKQDLQTRITKAKEIKNEGNKLYEQKEYDKAIQKYEKSIKYLININYDTDEKNTELLLSLYSNIANCYNKKGNFYNCVNIVNKAQIITQRSNAKLYYQRCISYANLYEFDKAEEDLNLLKEFLDDINDNTNNNNKKNEKEDTKTDNNTINYLKNLINNKKIIRENNLKEASKKLKLLKNKYQENNNIIENIPQKLLLIPDIINQKNKQIYFNIEIKEKKLDKKTIVIELFEKELPITCKNFYDLCTGKNKKNLTLKGSVFHRVLKDYVIEGGLINNKNICTYEKDNFDDEKSFYSHSIEGAVSMFRTTKNANGSRFFITLREAPFLDENHVVFGRVVMGMDVVEEIGDIDTDENDKPINECTIIECGEHKRIVTSIQN